ncbi:hypothetical protein ABID82_002351 [Methylobacterium sp. PvP062]|uniref:Uncharacterized protein n=1 Tax=Methylobacterium radiotolerans TaxID=31998 RepID=A0ABV2NNJ4_9HYPH|nr:MULTISPECIES: hypothetical protein [unclassified Methylobacterium]MBP2495317.1 hypothetical protein [Methylobacterium sp. PvP105]MBP2504812.1 hypothetical protein [Methylobacterium sp. PvP109]MCX7335819.1 hypothetical protein [Hyphomicrobiales bacterium]
MQADAAVRKQLATRLKRLRQKAVAVSAEIELVERLLIGLEKGPSQPIRGLRKNSVARLSFQSIVRQTIEKSGSPLKSAEIFKALIDVDPGLKPATFRSHLKRMVDAGVLTRKGPRGFYDVVDKNFDTVKEIIYPKKRPDLSRYED